MNHKTITEFLDYLASQTKRASVISYLLVGTGFLLYAHPMVGGSKYDLVRYKWVLPNSSTPDWGTAIGRFYAYAPHRCQWGWKYIIWLDKDSPSAAWVAADTAWEEDLELLEDAA